MNFNKVFGKNVFYDYIKSDKNPEVLQSLQKVYFLKYVLMVKAWVFLMKLQYLFLSN